MSNAQDSNSRKVTALTLQQKKKAGERITMLTAYDYPTACALEQAGIDVALVGDSLGMVVLGYANTLPVTMEDMLHHCKAVARGVCSAHLVADMPFMSYQADIKEAVRNAGRFLQEGGAEAVKLEGGRERTETIRAIVSCGIPVMGHLGVTPQSLHLLGGYRPQGKSADAAKRIWEDARILQDCGCYAVVLEVVPDRLASLISRKLDIPTLGIGAGRGCDGQVLVSHDLLGLYAGSSPKFAKKYAEFRTEMVRAFRKYREEVLTGAFPGPEHAPTIDDQTYGELLSLLEGERNSQDQ